MNRLPWIGFVLLGILVVVPPSFGQQPEKQQEPPLQKKPKDKKKEEPKQEPAAPQPDPEDLAAQFQPFDTSPFDISQFGLRQAPEMLGDQPPRQLPFELLFNRNNPFLQSLFSGATGPLTPQQIQDFAQAQGIPLDQATIQLFQQAQQQEFLVLPGPRGFKVADNGSPRPMDRVYVFFNYFDDLNRSVNRRLGQRDSHVNLYRETFGFEKTFLGGYASVDVRIPLNTLTISGTQTLNGTYTALGDLSTTFRYALYRDVQADNYLTCGLAVTAPTGPDTLADINTPVSLPHSTILQPFVGWLWNRGDWYFHGFTAVDVPTASEDVTFLFNDIGFGYFLYDSPNSCRLVTAVIPTAEVHVTTPLNNRGPIDFDNPLGAADEVNLTFGSNIRMRRRLWFAFGVAVPLVGPNPFDIEGTAQFRIWF